MHIPVQAIGGTLDGGRWQRLGTCRNTATPLRSPGLRWDCKRSRVLLGHFAFARTELEMNLVSEDSIQRSMRLAETVVSDDSPTYVIAEIGHNHQGSIETAKKMFAAAKTAGANAVKL